MAHLAAMEEAKTLIVEGLGQVVVAVCFLPAEKLEDPT